LNSITQTGLRKGDAGQHRGDEHIFSGLQFVVVGAGQAQVFAYEADRL
jgi:hypothetical protein